MSTENIQKAVLKLILDEPFFASWFMRMQFLSDESVPTACTDGRRVLFNPKWLGQFDTDHIVGVLAHEVMHVTNLHHLRMDGLNMRRANIAADCAINSLLVQCGFKLPTACVFPANYGLPDDKHFEWYYMNLPESENGEGNGPGDGGSGFGDVMPMTNGEGSPLSDAQKQDEVAQAELDNYRAAKAAKMCGKLHKVIEELVGSMMRPTLDWREMLRQFLDKTAKNQWDWSRPSRRFEDAYLPQRKGVEMKPIAVYLDQSGSVDNADQEKFFSELNDIIGNSFPCTVHVSVFDTQVLKTKAFTHDDYPIQPLRAACGGTDLRVPFDHAATLSDEIACCIVFTDLMGPQYDTERAFPTLWISTVKEKDAGQYLPKYGEIAYME